MTQQVSRSSSFVLFALFIITVTCTVLATLTGCDTILRPNKIQSVTLLGEFGDGCKIYKIEESCCTPMTVVVCPKDQRATRLR
jgi:hypothetical protein